MSATHKNILAALNGRQSRNVANNTKAIRNPDGSVAIRLHATDILTAKPDGTVAVNSGGWRTVTTKARLNDWLADGLGIWQTGGVWKWSRFNESARAGGQYSPAWQTLGVFSDGDSIGPRGALQLKAKAGAEMAARKLALRINKYAALCASAVPMNPPSGGDCWHCYMIAENAQSRLPRSAPICTNAKPAAVTLSDASGNTEHLLSHIAEGYVVPSLVMHALREAGNGDLILAAAFRQDGTASWSGLARDRVRKAVRRYLKRRLALAGN